MTIASTTKVSTKPSRSTYPALTRLATKGRLLKQSTKSISKPTVMKNIPSSSARNGAMSASTLRARQRTTNNENDEGDNADDDSDNDYNDDDNITTTATTTNYNGGDD